MEKLNIVQIGWFYEISIEVMECNKNISVKMTFTYFFLTSMLIFSVNKDMPKEVQSIHTCRSFLSLPF